MKRNKIIFKKLFTLIFLCLFIINNSIKIYAGEKKNNSQKNVYPPPFQIDRKSLWVDSVFESLTLDERIAQMFVIPAYSNRGGINSQHAQYVNEMIERYNIGGLIFMQGGPVNQAILTNYFQENAKTPLMIGMDAEWGLGMRLDSTVSFPRQMMLGALSQNELIYLMSSEIAHQFIRLGVHINFSPVVDINNNPKNPVIKDRSFGENKYNVSEKALQVMAGLQDHGILSVAKHFPGHGDTEIDSHSDLPIIKYGKKRLDTLELFPYKYLIRRGLGGVMVGHLNITTYDKKNTVASSLSNKIVNKLLRDKLHFKGLIFTDALSMEGVTKYYKPGELEVEAVKAGNDVLLFVQDVPVAINAIKNAIVNGLIDEDDINDRCRKILVVKRWMQLNKPQYIDTTNLFSDLNNSDTYFLKSELIEKAITVVKNNDSLLPFKRLDTLKIASIAIGESFENIFQKNLSNYVDISNYQTYKNPSEYEFERINKYLDDKNLVIISIHKTSNSPATNFGLNERTRNFIKKISEKKRVVLCLFSNAYSLNLFSDIESIDAICLSYDDNDLIQRACSHAIMGAIPNMGRLPISSGKFKEGSSFVARDFKRFKYLEPFEVNMDINKLNTIDSIANNAIAKKATPGCQVLVARKGAIIFNRSYGYHSYDSLIPVKNSDLYDIASITKIAATLASLMKLQDEGRFSLDTTLGYYLPELDSTNKGGLYIRDILTHQARLRPWIPFYLTLIKDYNDPNIKVTSQEYTSRYSIPLDYNLYLDNQYTFRDSLLYYKYTDTFSIHVAENLYMNKCFVDSVYRRINLSELRQKKEYKYSDLGYYYLRRFIENETKTGLEKYVDSVFYSRLGTRTLGYLPLRKFSYDKIVPTEYDRVFRCQVITGYVHDPGAAMLGGVGGHAGLFSNAQDLAIMMQMYLNRGYYSGIQFIKPETIDLYSSCPFCDEGNRRGYGFDRSSLNPAKDISVPNVVSESSYGHTGFTGTIAWIDPKYELIYIFLSNRIHPDALNRMIYKLDLRPSIHRVIYKAMLPEN